MKTICLEHSICHRSLKINYNIYIYYILYIFYIFYIIILYVYIIYILAFKIVRSFVFG